MKINPPPSRAWVLASFGLILVFLAYGAVQMSLQADTTGVSRITSTTPSSLATSSAPFAQSGADGIYDIQENASLSVKSANPGTALRVIARGLGATPGAQSPLPAFLCPSPM